MKPFTGVVAGWLGRRALELSGIIGTLAAAYFALPDQQQNVVQFILNGNWQDITLGALVPFVIYVFSQVLSFRATVKDQIVVDGQRVDPKRDIPTGKRVMVEEVATTAVARKKRAPSVLERMFGRRR
jgi:ammonia channel protein AmtB